MINIILQDYFDIIGSIISTLVIIYDLFIVKFINLNTIGIENDSSIGGRIYKIKKTRFDSFSFGNSFDV